MMSSIPPVALNIYPVMSFQQLIVCVAAVWCCSSNAARQPDHLHINSKPNNMVPAESGGMLGSYFCLADTDTEEYGVEGMDMW